MDTNNLEAEKSELDILIDQGMTFTVPKQSLLRFFGKKERTFMLRQPFLGTLDKISSVSIDLGSDFSQEELEANPLAESKRLTLANARLCAKIVAIAVLNSQWSIFWLTPFLTQYFLWRVTPKTLFLLTFRIQQLSNLGDFINSIRYLSANRTTSPNRMEKTPEVQPAA